MTLWSLFFFPFMHDPKDGLAAKMCVSELAGQVKWVPIHLMTKLESFGKDRLTQAFSTTAALFEW